jgi:hypothetical protein
MIGGGMTPVSLNPEDLAALIAYLNQLKDSQEAE